MQTPKAPIYTEPNDCRDCYRCVSVCPTKSIMVRQGSASVIASSCVACGDCVKECPRGVQRIRSDVDRVIDLLNGRAPVVVSLSSAWRSEFSHFTLHQVCESLRALGFEHISQEAHGANLMAEASIAQAMRAKPGVLILPVCPAATELIQREWPYWAENILSVASPLEAHALMLREVLGPEVRIVGIGSCTAQKQLADTRPELIDCVLTYGELHSWMLDRGIHPSQFPEAGTPTLVPWAAPRGHTYSVSGGVLRDIMRSWPSQDDDTEFMAFSGLLSIRRALTGLESWGHDRKLILELMVCDGGCINGPASSLVRSMAQRKLDVIRMKDHPYLEAERPRALHIDLRTDYPPKGEDTCRVYTHQEVAAQLAKVGKYSVGDETNCGCCGYNTCQAFAIGLCQGKAEPDMCIAYERQLAEGKFEVLLNHMPSGVILVDADLRIVEANWNLASMLGGDVVLAYDQHPGLKGLDARPLIPFSGLLEQVMETGERIEARDLQLGGALLRVSLFTVQRNALVCAITRNLYQSDVRSEVIVQRTETLIRENLSTVQKIAYLLGENASKTEMELSAILQAFGGGHNE